MTTTRIVGRGVLRECLRDPAVTRVLAVGWRPTGVSHPELTEFVRGDLFDWSDSDAMIADYDACFFCLGVSAAGVSEVMLPNAGLRRGAGRRRVSAARGSRGCGGGLASDRSPTSA